MFAAALDAVAFGAAGLAAVAFGGRSGVVNAAQAVRKLPALVRVGLLESFAYRGEMLVWVLSSTMPFIMLALFSAVAEEGPVGRYGPKEFVAYFLTTFVVRQLTSSWVSWQINMEVRDGTLAARLLRPVHPLLTYAADGIAAMPMRVLVSIPAAVALFIFAGSRELAHDPAVLLLWCVSLVGAWLISLFVSCGIGALAFFMESSTKVTDLWLAVFFVFSGYLVPIDLFPAFLREILAFLPFPYQVGLPVELITGAHDRVESLRLVAQQWAFVVVTGVAMGALWRKGLSRFAAFGG